MSVFVASLKFANHSEWQKLDSQSFIHHVKLLQGFIRQV